MKKVFAALVVSTALLMTPGSASADVSNGSFETGVNPGVFATLAAGNTNVTGWTIVSGSIDYIGTYWAAADGNRSIDLSGSAPGAISAPVDTIPGGVYRVRFAMAGNPDGGPTVKTLVADAGAFSAAFSFDTTGASLSDMGWTTKSFDFLASDSETTLLFTSTTSGPWGPAVDDVQVTLLGLVEERHRNVGGAAGAIAAAVSQQARENRERVAAAAQPPAVVAPPSTGTGLPAGLPSTGNAGLLDHGAADGPSLVLLLVPGALIALWTGRRFVSGWGGHRHRPRA
jgi:choice-of-anchor C domain-containing protein